MVIYTQKFESDVKKLRGSPLTEGLKKQIAKVVEHPDVGKPLRYGLRGERTLRAEPYMLIYAVQGENLILLRFEHRKNVYG